MSVHRDREAWRVRYRDAGGRQRSRSFSRKGDAVMFDREMARRLQLGPALAAELNRQTMTLADYVAGPWRAHSATLAQPTRDKYAWALEKHLAELVDEPLMTIDAPMIAAHQRLLLDRGATPSTVREAIAKLSGVLQIAAEHGQIPGNPARSVRNVPAEHRDEIAPLTPVEHERLLAMPIWPAGPHGRGRRENPPEVLTNRDRAIMALGGYFGLRPQEIRKVPWTALSDGALTIGRAQTKATARRSRVITGPALGMRELRTWRLESGGRGAEPIVGEMTANALRLWGHKRLRPAVERVTEGRITDATVYTLRHSHASMCHYVSGLTLPDILRRMGHSQQTHFLHYAHIIDAFDGARYGTLDELIEAARAVGDLDRRAAQ
jgi:integrase